MRLSYLYFFQSTPRDSDAQTGLRTTRLIIRCSQIQMQFMKSVHSTQLFSFWVLFFPLSEPKEARVFSGTSFH